MVCASSNKAVSVVTESYLINQKKALPSPGSVVPSINAVLIGVEDKISSLTPLDTGAVNEKVFIAAALELQQLINIRVMILCADMNKADCHPLDSYSWRELIPSALLKLISAVLIPQSSMDLLVYQYAANAHKYLQAMNVLLDVCKRSLSNDNKSHVTKFCDNIKPDSSSKSMLLSLYVTVRCLLSIVVTDYLNFMNKLKSTLGNYYNNSFRSKCQLIRGKLFDLLGVCNKIINDNMETSYGGMMTSDIINCFAACAKDDSGILTESCMDVPTLVSDTMNSVTSLATAIIDTKREKFIVDALVAASTIIFCTLSTSGNSIIRRIVGAVDVLLVDEAGQASEAECLVPFLLHPQNMVLIGDPKQLPPTLLSLETVQRGWNTHLLNILCASIIILFNCWKYNIEWIPLSAVSLTRFSTTDK